jgi:hypothetical protein
MHSTIWMLYFNEIKATKKEKKLESQELTEIYFMQSLLGKARI